MKRYFLSKLSEINYRMSIHEGDANRRLASEAYNIGVFPTQDAPEKYRNTYEELKKVLNATLDNVRYPLVPIRIHHIRNVTAAKYIKLLIDIEQGLRDELGST